VRKESGEHSVSVTGIRDKLRRGEKAVLSNAQIGEKASNEEKASAGPDSETSDSTQGFAQKQSAARRLMM